MLKTEDGQKHHIFSNNKAIVYINSVCCYSKQTFKTIKEKTKKVGYYVTLPVAKNKWWLELLKNLEWKICLQTWPSYKNQEQYRKLEYNESKIHGRLYR